jgi:tRNA (adenine37-N6)-methyltransferase
MPIQAAASEVAGWLDIEPAYIDGLRDLDGFSHVTLLFVFDRAAAARMTVMPFLDDTPRGVFATRAPTRPNAIGLSTVRLVAVAGTRIDIEGVDMLDETPLLDIKPYVPAFDDRPATRIGWYQGRLEGLPGTRADRRFDRDRP